LGGRLVRDCHAEILARKGFLKYLYNELNRLLIVEQNEEGGQRSKMTGANVYVCI
jgi:hypothetical protein